MRLILLGLIIATTVLFARPFEKKEYNFPIIGKLSEQEREEAVDFIERYGGELRVSMLEELKWRAPFEYERHLRRSLMKKRDLERLMEKDEELYRTFLGVLELERHSYDLAAEYRKTENEGVKDEIKAELKGILSREFDLKQEERTTRIKHLEEEIADLKDGLEDRERRKEKIVERRLEVLLDKSKYLEW